MIKVDGSLLRTDAGESDLELPGDDLEGQRVEQQGGKVNGTVEEPM